MRLPLFRVITLSAAFLGGCGGLQVGGSASPVAAAQVNTRTSSGDLLYVSYGKSEVLSFSYPQGALVQTLAVSYPGSECSDTQGNVFIVNMPSRDIYQVTEYAHGGTSPIKSFEPFSYGFPISSCAVDPSTGNLAIVGSRLGSNDSSEVAIYSNQQGQPTVYVAPGIHNWYSAKYDESSNLFIVDSLYSYDVLTRFTSGSFAEINVKQNISGYGGIVRYKGDFLLADLSRATVYQVSVSGSRGTVVGSTALNGHFGLSHEIWFGGGTLLVPVAVHVGHGRHFLMKSIGFFKYPKGGAPYKQIMQKTTNSSVGGFTISVPTSSQVSI